MEKRRILIPWVLSLVPMAGPLPSFFTPLRMCLRTPNLQNKMENIYSSATTPHWSRTGFCTSWLYAIVSQYLLKSLFVRWKERGITDYPQRCYSEQVTKITVALKDRTHNAIQWLHTSKSDGNQIPKWSLCIWRFAIMMALRENPYLFYVCFYSWPSFSWFSLPSIILLRSYFHHNTYFLTLMHYISVMRTIVIIWAFIIVYDNLLILWAFIFINTLLLLKVTYP